MRLAILIGLQASGKTTFYRQELAKTHTHVSKDNFPNARHRQRRQLGLITAALAAGQDVAVDNTNPTPTDWEPLVAAGREYGAEVVGYWFPPDVETSLSRNAARASPVPEVGLFATLKLLTKPSLVDGFDSLYEVLAHSRVFKVTPIT